MCRSLKTKEQGWFKFTLHTSKNTLLEVYLLPSLLMLCGTFLMLLSELHILKDRLNPVHGVLRCWGCETLLPSKPSPSCKTRDAEELPLVMERVLLTRVISNDWEMQSYKCNQQMRTPSLTETYLLGAAAWRVWSRLILCFLSVWCSY